jgi:vacuolar protein sorting-associated protein 29
VVTQGSITGAYTSLTRTVTPSFVLLSIQGSKVVCYVYELINDEVEVSKREFTKETPEKRTAPMLQSLLA